MPALIWLCTPASDLPAAANQSCATLFFTCTKRMPAFSGPLTLPKRVSKSSSPSPSLPFTTTTALAPWLRALIALVMRAAWLGEPLIAALRGEAAGLVAKQDDDLALHVEAGVIVVAEFVGGGAVAGEDEPALSLRPTRKS